MQLKLLYMCFTHTLLLGSPSTAPVGHWFCCRDFILVEGRGGLLQIASFWSPLLGEIQYLY